MFFDSLLTGYSNIATYFAARYRRTLAVLYICKYK